jgi:hypothetical protein
VLGLEKSPGWVTNWEVLPQVRTSEDKVRRKDLCGFVRTFYVLEKLSNVSRPDLVKTGHYSYYARRANN